MTEKKYALVLYPRDNVATLLNNVSASEIITLKGSDSIVTAGEKIDFGHKIALQPIKNGEDIIKYGQKIGIATKDINTGKWVHIHNMSSSVDLTFNKRLES